MDSSCGLNTVTYFQRLQYEQGDKKNNYSREIWQTRPELHDQGQRQQWRVMLTLQTFDTM